MPVSDGSVRFLAGAGRGVAAVIPAPPQRRHTRRMNPDLPILLLVDPALAAPLLESLRRQAPALAVLPYSRGLDDAALAPLEVALGWRFPPGLAPRLPNLRWVCSIAAGVEKLLVPELPARVQVSRMVDPDQALGIAQYVAAVVLRQTRGLAVYDVQQQQALWQRRPMAAARHRVVVLGYGEVGREIGRVLTALGLQVSGWRRSSGALLPVLAASDIVVNALPLTPQTQGLLDAAAFTAMPRGSYLVNIARGGHVVEADLIAAVQSGHLAGAALDVQAVEPMPPDDPLWRVPGIAITPHIAAQSSPDVVVAQFLASLDRVRQGLVPLNPVDRTLGY